MAPVTSKDELTKDELNKLAEKADAIGTPWGSPERLRRSRRQPPPSSGGSSRANAGVLQRERLYAAMVAMGGEHGYQWTRVGDLLKVAGISRNSFYKHFDNKLDCFEATVAELATTATTQIVQASSEGTSWDDRLRLALETLIDLTIEQPAAARLCIVEPYSAGQQVAAEMEPLAQGLEDLVSRSFAESAKRADIPHWVLRAILGGLRAVLHSRLRTREEAELAELAPALLQWGLSYKTPAHLPAIPPATPVAARPEADDPHMLVVNAMIETVTALGYPDTSISEISKRAGISLTTFYTHFGGKDEAFTASFEYGQEQVLRAMLPAYGKASDWRLAVRDAIRALMAFLADNPDIAWFAGAEIYIGGPLRHAGNDESLIKLPAFLETGHVEYPGVPEIADEAIRGAIDTLIHDHLRNEGAESLSLIAPAAAFVALTPFIGPAEAWAIADEREQEQPAASPPKTPALPQAGNEVEIPEALRRFDSGRPQPDWSAAIRESREEH